MSIQQASTSSAKAAILQKNDNDVVIVCAVRSAITKGRKGGFKDTKPELILSHVLRAAYSKISLDPKLIEDIAVGNVLPPGGGASAARMAALHAGIPVETSINTVNRQCSSGLRHQPDREPDSRRADRYWYWSRRRINDTRLRLRAAPKYRRSLSNQDAEDCLLPMGITSENVAADYHIPRSTQDAFSAKSFQKAAAANKAGKFKSEIVPILAKWIDPKTEEVKEVLVNEDDGIREGVTAESLRRLNLLLRKMAALMLATHPKSQTAAAAIILARRSVATRLGLPILGKFVNASTIGVPPRIMGVGPAYAIPRVLKLTGLSLDDVDFFEINEAFASQALFSIDTLKIAHEKVNLNGGAIALGHPLGCTGARQVATGLNIAKQTGGRVFVTSMCIGSGMGMAAVFVSEQ
uniref:Acetyl-CoA acetyltransferase n=1 Tax=Laccaria bicolor TaxID=29883 RepID=Q96X18_LACBI|nr:acetyl-CoA acetyltransferase [Laccaria bicolor]